ncbi:hypothetical protein [Mixta sp. Marseille-Q2659]|uniref:hypothetical protein n=1 Tax=Mixta sp. Marseille-Q2659 TaxID=2736607 RepID=UPI0023B96A2B|nr:hypothetical protein [Mixta sp. Marseille-Q2659]
MSFSFLTRLLITTVVANCAYAGAAELPDINGAVLTPPAEQFSVMPSTNAASGLTTHQTVTGKAMPQTAAPVTEMTASSAHSLAAADSVSAPYTSAPVSEPAGDSPDTSAQPSVSEPAHSSPVSGTQPNALSSDHEEEKQEVAIKAVLQAIRQRQLTPLSTECLSMSFVDNSDEPENYLIDVRENRNHPACGGDPETAPHLFFFKVSKTDGSLQTDAGVEPEDFYPLEKAEQPAAAALTAEDFSIQVNGITLSLGQIWNEDLMMSMPPERDRSSNLAKPTSTYRYDRHSYDALTLVASNENYVSLQHSPDDNYVGQITLINPTLATQRGARVGMTPDELERRYGPGEADEHHGESWLSWQLDDKTLAARISNGRVTLITLSNLQPDADAAE